MENRLGEHVTASQGKDGHAAPQRPQKDPQGLWIQQRHVEAKALKAMVLEKTALELWESRAATAPTVFTPPGNVLETQPSGLGSVLNACHRSKRTWV